MQFKFDKPIELENMTVLAILQARMSSSRLPGKVLLPILGRPMLYRQIERLKRCKRIDHLLVATSNLHDDDAIADACAEWGVGVFRGSLNDVLDRYVEAARQYETEIIVRVTGDCPLIDPGVVDKVIEFYIAGGFDYATNCNPPTYPDGLDVEVVSYSCLNEAWQEAKLPSEREHVTPFLRSHPERFRLGNYSSCVDYSSLRWTVDEPEDFEFVRQVYAALYQDKPDFGMEDILGYLEAHPEVKSVNNQFERNAGIQSSYRKDEEYRRKDAMIKPIDIHNNGD